MRLNLYFKNFPQRKHPSTEQSMLNSTKHLRNNINSTQTHPEKLMKLNPKTKQNYYNKITDQYPLRNVNTQIINILAN